MLSIIALTIIAIGIVSTLGYGVLSTIRATESVTMAQRNVAQVETIASLLRASVRPVGGVPRAPMGDKISMPGGTVEITGLPNWIGGSRTTPWGAPYAYCPYATADDGEPDESIVHGDGSGGHRVKVADGYVVSDDADPPAVAGDEPLMLVLSPVIGKPLPPRCDDVVVDGSGAYRIRADAAVGGTVMAITRDSLAAAGLVAQEAILFVDPAPDPEGSGSGRSPGSAMTLSDALALWRSSLPRALTLRMAAGNYDLTKADAENLAASGGAPGRGLRLVGGGAAMITPADGASELRLPFDVTLDGVAIAGGVLVRPTAGTRLLLRDSTVSRIDAEGAHVVAEGAVDVTGAGAPGGGAALRVGGGRLTVAEGATLTASLPGGLAGATAIRVDNGTEASLSLGSTLSISAPGGYGIWVDGGARLTAWGAEITVSGTLAAAFYAGGSLLGLYGTPVSFDSAGTSVGTWIVLRSGMLDMRSFAGGAATALGGPDQRASFGVEDAGGHALSGGPESFVYARAACFSGLLFPATSYAPGDTAANSVSGTAAAYANRASWTCR